jgi:acid stress-induced BolA-like protein IbaG/YrbA
VSLRLCVKKCKEICETCRHVADYLHVFIVSDAFEKYSLMKRHKIVEQAMKESLYDDPIYPKITLVMPVTQEEFNETYAYVRE